MKELIQFRRTLWELIQLVQLLGSSRELSLAVTALQSSRMRLGNVMQGDGAPTPYAQADDPASAAVVPHADVPEVPMDWRKILDAGEAAGGPIANVKFARVAVRDLVNDLALYRKTRWARQYGTLGELLFDLSLADAMQARNWLGEQLAVLNGKPLVKPAARVAAVGFATVDKVKELIEAALRGVLGEPSGTLSITVGDGTDAPLPKLEDALQAAPAAALEAGVVKVLADAAAAGTEPAVTPELAGLAVAAVDDTIRTHLEAGATVTAICRDLNVTEHRVSKIKKAWQAAKKAAATAAPEASPETV